MNTFDQATAPRAMAWRKPGQGFDFGFTGKGSHEGTGGAVAHFVAAIAYEKGVIAAEQYHGRINAEKCSSFVGEHFHSMGNFSYRMVIFHRTVEKPDLPGMRLVLGNLPFQQEVRI